MCLGKLFRKIANKAVGSVMGNDLSQDLTVAEGERYVTPGIGACIRRAGAESCVLLKNDGVLPLSPDREIAVFGRCQLDWFYVGYGSGGDVHAPYLVNLMDGLTNAGASFCRPLAEAYRAWTSANKVDPGWWGHWPFSHPEMPLSDELVSAAAASADTAVVVLGRAAGENQDNECKSGSYYLTDGEKAMLDAVTAAFRHTVVLLNVGSVMDMSWTETYGDKLSAILMVWLGGMESGNAVADVLYGKVNPCGKLPDTIARRYEDYPSSANFGGKDFNDYTEGIYVGYRWFDDHPEQVLWPFGFGLSYTSFAVEASAFERGSVTVRLTNTGTRPGSEVAQLWCYPPRGGLDKPRRVLAAFCKSDALQPGETRELTLTYDDRCIASYDETAHAFVLDPGEYRFTVNGTDVGSFALSQRLTVEQCEPICLPPEQLRQRILAHMPKPVPAPRKLIVKLGDVMARRATPDDFIARLSDRELEALTRGHGMMNSPLGVPGNAGVMGGILPSLRAKGVPPIVCCDGPAGLRMARYCALIPCGTALAATWNTELVARLHVLLGQEMIHYGADVLLSPGMNIHRNPLCGRNFEYYSEDPLLTGKMAAAAVRGVQSTGRAACPKHFACNHQEYRRNCTDSRVSERALREIYLRGFEICVKEASPLTLMTSYNKVNGVWSHYNYDLVTTVLRGEWGYTGMVMTDWWMRKSASPEFPLLRDNAYRVRAQVDVLMPGDMSRTAKRYRSDGTLLKTLGKPGGMTRGELQRSAGNVLRLILRLKG